VPLILIALTLLPSPGGTVCADDLSASLRAVRRNRQERRELLPPPRPLSGPCPSLEELGYSSKPLVELSLNIELKNDKLPDDCAQEVFHSSRPGGGDRGWPSTDFHWVASDLWHQPAYFDDPILERYGQAHPACVQPWLSGAHFFAQFPIMPYKLALDRPFERVYTLGYHRPGSPTPLLTRRLPFEPGPAGFEAATWLAFIFILP